MSISNLTFVGILSAADPAYIAATGTPPAIQGSQRPDQTNSELLLVFIGNLTGSYANGGDPLDFTAAAPSNYSLPSTAPTKVWIEELGVIGTAVPGFQYQYVYGPAAQPWTPQGGAVQIFGAGAGSGQGGTQITAGAYANTTPSLNNTQIKIVALFGKG